MSSLSKVIFVLGKARSHRAPNLGYRGAEAPRWFDVSPKNSAWDVMHEQACCRHEAANHQLPIPAAFWIIQIVSAEECSSLMQNLMQIRRSTHSVILNVTATQYTRSLNGVYRPHWLVQWSCHWSCMYIPVHSPWLPGYIDVPQTILINNGWTYPGHASYSFNRQRWAECHPHIRITWMFVTRPIFEPRRLNPTVGGKPEACIYQAPLLIPRPIKVWKLLRLRQGTSG